MDAVKILRAPQRLMKMDEEHKPHFYYGALYNYCQQTIAMAI